MHYYQFNIADYRKDTAHLTPMEHYVYRQLIDWYYLDEQPIPKITQVVMRRLSLGSEHKATLENVLHDFFENDENGWIHLRIERDISDYHTMQDRNKKNGAKGGRPKKQQLTNEEKPKKTQSVSSGLPDESECKGNQELITNNHKLKEDQNTSSPTATASRFDEFWNAYPKKRSKKPCMAKWKAKRLDAVADTLIADVSRRMVMDRRWLEGFTPDPLTYLNQERWEDEVEAANPMVKIPGESPVEHVRRVSRMQEQQESGPMNLLSFAGGGR